MVETFATSMPPDAVFARMQTIATEWRDSAKPAYLRVGGLSDPTLEVTGDRFLISIGTVVRGHISYVAVGEVRTTPGGTLVSFEVRPSRWTWGQHAFFILVSIVAAARLNAWILPVAAGAMLAIFTPFSFAISAQEREAVRLMVIDAAGGKF